MPSVNKLYEEFRGRGFEVRLINFREKPDDVRQAASERGYTAPVLLDTSGDVTGRIYGVWGPPTAYFVDREGRLVGRVVGSRDWASPQARALVRGLVEDRTR